MYRAKPRYISSYVSICVLSRGTVASIQLDIGNSRLPFGTANVQGRRTIQIDLLQAGIAHAAYSRLGGPHAASRRTGGALYWLFGWRRSRHDGHSSVAKMPLAEHHDMVKAVPPDRTDQPLRISVLPWRLRCNRPIPDPNRSKTTDEDAAIDTVAIAYDVSGRLLPATCLGELTGNPFRARVCRYA
jgi:hypothetical protein